MICTLTLALPAGGTTTMSLSDQSPGPQTAGGQRMTGAQIKAAFDAGGQVYVYLFDNQAPLLVSNIVES